MRRAAFNASQNRPRTAAGRYESGGQDLKEIALSDKQSQCYDEDEAPFRGGASWSSRSPNYGRLSRVDAYSCFTGWGAPSQHDCIGSRPA